MKRFQKWNNKNLQLLHHSLTSTHFGTQSVKTILLKRREKRNCTFTKTKMGRRKFVTITIQMKKLQPFPKKIKNKIKPLTKES
jgi:hypothetical protein